MTCSKAKGDHASFIDGITINHDKDESVADITSKAKNVLNKHFQISKEESRDKLTDVTGLVPRTKMVPKQRYYMRINPDLDLRQKLHKL